jgi:hypothetical protein
MKTAETQAAPAVAKMDNALKSGFLPDDPYYRLHGRFRDAEDGKEKIESTEDQEESGAAIDEKEETADTADEAAAGETSNAKDRAETAAASETATTQEKKPAGKTPAASESRWQKLSRENRELRERLTRVETKGATPPAARETSQGSQPAADKARPEPQIDDVDAKTGKPKYASYADYSKDLRAWDREQVKRELQSETAQSNKQTATEQAKQTIAREFSKRVESARTKYTDFDDVALNPDLPIREGSPVDLFTLDSDRGTDVLYHLGKNPSELERINKLNPVAQIRALTLIESTFSTKKPAASASSAKPVSQAPRPAHQLPGHGTAAGDPIEEATKTGDFESYRDAANARDPRIRALQKRK